MRGLSSPLQHPVSSLLRSNNHLCVVEFRKSSTKTKKFTATLPSALRCNLREHGSVKPSKLSSRRFADFEPCSWNYDFLGSLPTQDFTVEKQGAQREKMIAEVKEMMRESSLNSATRLKLVDAIERLGLARHFREEIKSLVEMVYRSDEKYPEDLHATALRFRVLRQHGYFVSEGILKKSKDDWENSCKDSSSAEDIKGLLSLYEATFVGWKRDDSLEELRSFASKELNELDLESLDGQRAKLEVEQALDIPLHWRFPRLKARWSIESYHDQTILHPTLIRLAKLDYNMLQSGYKDEIKRLVGWWKRTELPRKLPYMRDRLLEHYVWVVGLVEDPQYPEYREMETKVVTLITALDDTYDVYGSVEELEIFTDLLDRWDTSGLDQLPEAMRWCFLAIYDTGNEIAAWALQEKRFNILPYLSKAWARLGKAYLQEAKWYAGGYKPSLTDEYLPLATVSISGHLMLILTYLLTAPAISEEALHYIDSLPNLLRRGSKVVRMTNDLGTSSDELARGDNIKSLQCFMNDTGASEKAARDYIQGLIHETWKKINEEYYLFPPRYPETICEPFLSACLNFARTSHFYYNYNKDWHGKPDEEMIYHLTTVLINPVPM